MKREFQKEIYLRIRLRNKCWVQPSAEIKTYMDKISEKGIKTNTIFWNFI